MPKNKFETRVQSQLRRSKVSFKYESEKIPYILARHYIPDFVVTTPTGKIYVECKGYFRPEHKSKMVAVKKCNPKLDIRIVFYSFNERNVKWALRHGFKYSIEKIPKEWLEGW